MPKNKNTISVLVLNASLKHAPDLSNTEEVTNLVLKAMKKHGTIEAETIRLSDRRIPVGLGFKESADDEWPEIVGKLKAADVVIFATPIWWGGRSSLMQRVIERMDALDEEYIKNGRAVQNKDVPRHRQHHPPRVLGRPAYARHRVREGQAGRENPAQTRV
jgi:multimeric flavodoxin WrbA